MRCPTIHALPPPPASKRGWPWTEETPEVAHPHAPRVSIVTPSYNQAEFLEETIRSVLLQGYRDLDYLIVDGGSTDGSVEIIRKYEPWLSYWVSEADRGQCHAINKGLEHASGTYFNYLNSDDTLAPGALHAVARAFERHPSALMVHGKCVLADEDGRALSVYQGRGGGGEFADMFLNLVSGNGLHPLTVFSRLPPVRDAGGYREALDYEMDADLWLRLLDGPCEVRTIDDCLGMFRCHGAQKSASHRRIDELLAVLSQALDRRRDLTASSRRDLARRAARQCARQKLWAASSSFERGQYSDYLACCAGALRISPRVVTSWVFWTNAAAPVKPLVPARMADAGRKSIRHLAARIEGLHH
jgi:glycosyltransferase involved in cell wall biosynthesis